MTGATFVTNGVLSYDMSEPFAVTLTVKGDPDDQPVTWTISRQLFSAGLTTENGELDVRIGPDPTSFGRLIRIELAPPHGRAVLVAGLSAVEHFLDQTFALVPDGEEALEGDLDAELEKLLRDTPGGATPGGSMPPGW